MNETVAYLGLGTNMGDREENLRAALRLLSENDGVRLRRWSRVYETEPWGVTDQPKFLNLSGWNWLPPSPPRRCSPCAKT